MEIQWGKELQFSKTFDRLEIGDVFQARDYDGIVFMKISVEAEPVKKGDLDTKTAALDLEDGVSFEMLDREPVELLKAYVVVER